MTKHTTDTTKTVKAAKKGKQTEVLILIDESGSMNGMQESVTNGVNEFIHGFKDDKNTKISVVAFDKHPGESRTRFLVKSKNDPKELKITDYKPRGMTPLNDAIMDVVTYLDKKVKDGGAFVTIITDGLENASETSFEEVKKALAKREKQGWVFIYLGADHNAQQAAMAMGLNPKQAFNYNKSAGGMAAAMSTSSSVGRGYTSMGQSGTLSMVEDLHDKTQGKLEDEDEDS